MIEKKKQLSLKSMSEGRQRSKQKRQEEEMQRERKQQLEEEKRLYVLCFYFFEICFACGLARRVKELFLMFFLVKWGESLKKKKMR